MAEYISTRTSCIIYSGRGDYAMTVDQNFFMRETVKKRFYVLGQTGGCIPFKGTIRIKCKCTGYAFEYGLKCI